MRSSILLLLPTTAMLAGCTVVSRLFRTLVGGVLRLSDQSVTLLEQFHV
jgi:hypothetical protein